MLCRAVLCRARNPLPPLCTVPAQPHDPRPTHSTSKTDPISSGEVAWARHQDFVPTCLQSHMSPPIGCSQRDGVGWDGVGWGGGGGGHVPSLKGLQALVGFQTLGSRPQPTSTPQACGDHGTSLILGGTRGGPSLTGGGGLERVLGWGGGGGLGVMVHKSVMFDVCYTRYTQSCSTRGWPPLGLLTLPTAASERRANNMTCTHARIFSPTHHFPEMKFPCLCGGGGGGGDCPFIPIFLK